MNVLVLQRFLAVSFQVCCIKQSKLQANSKHFQAFPSVTSLLKCVKHSKPLVCSSHQECWVWLPSPIVYSKLPVYRPLALSMAEAVMVRSLDLMDSYYTLSVSSSHQLLILCSLIITSPRSNNKDCTEAEYLYSSSAGASAEALTCEFFELLRRYWSSQGAPHISSPHPALQTWTPLSQLGPVHELTSMNNCCHPLR